MATGADIVRAAEILRRGGLVAFPTETVYGLGADAGNPAAVARLYAVKGRPGNHPVIVHVGAPSQLADWAADVPEAARRLGDALWPGPLTVVVRRAASVPDAVTGGGDTVGVRVPDQPVALALLRAFGSGIAAPSANRFGRVSPTTADHVRADLGSDVDLVIDGGPCAVGVESTIVDVTGREPSVLRVGGVSEARLAGVVGAPLARRTSGEVAAPGTLVAHYSPRARVELVDAEGFKERSEQLRAQGSTVGVLEAHADVTEYARVLYARLRELDERGVDVILAAAPAETGDLGAAVA